MLTIEGYLSMSINNPVFVRDCDKLASYSLSLYQKGEITTDEHQSNLSRIQTKISSGKVAQVGRRFRWYETLRTKGISSIEFDERELMEIILARRASSDFYAWAAKERFYVNHPTFLQYINNTAKSFVNNTKSGSEERWDNYVDLRSAILGAFGRGTLYRDSCTAEYKVLALAVREAERLLQSTPELQFSGVLKESSFFGAATSSNTDTLNLGDMAYNLVLKFYSSVQDNSILAQQYMQQIEQLRSSGQLSENEFLQLKFFIQRYSSGLVSSGVVDKFEPILMRWVSRMTNQPGMEYSYTIKQITTALDYARFIFESFPDSEFVRTVLSRYIGYDYSNLVDPSDLKAELHQKFERNIQIFLKVGLISIEQAEAFRAQGRVEFGVK